MRELLEKCGLFVSCASDFTREQRLDLLNEIKAELAKPEPVGFAKWEPIETAPKDGTEILLFALFDIGLCYWSDKMDSWTWGAGNRFNLPSHWMPLPEIPSKCTPPPAQQNPLSGQAIIECIPADLKRVVMGNEDSIFAFARAIEAHHGIK